MPGEYRKKCFEAFYCSRSWEVQTTYIAGHVKTHTVNRRYGNTSPDKLRRQNTRHYYLDSKAGKMHRVCKPMFLKAICIYSVHVHRALQKVNSGNIIDQRDRHSAWKKLQVYCTSNGTQCFAFKTLLKGFFTLKICISIEIAKP